MSIDNETVILQISNEKGMGWMPDLPDFRDCTIDDMPIASALAGTNAPSSYGGTTSESSGGTSESSGAGTAPALSPTADLRAWFSPIEDQGSLGSCTANAGVALFEYFQRRAFGKHIDASRLFLYKATRNLLHWTGDTGAYLRSTMKSMVLFGVPPEEYWPYNIADFDKEPAAFLYAFGQEYKTTKYYRLDPSGTPKPVLLDRIKTQIVAGLPPMFGFTVYASIAQAAATGKIPFPTGGDPVRGGHAIDAVGFDDNKKIKNTNLGAVETTGSFLIRNSWGTGWGDHGYGWLPYEYVIRGLAVDWWSLIDAKWIDTGNFN